MMSQVLTEQQKLGYLSQLPATCPWCNSRRIKPGALLPQPDGRLRCLVTCVDCRQEWYEVYQRVGIEDCFRPRLYIEDEE